MRCVRVLLAAAALTGVSRLSLRAQSASTDSASLAAPAAVTVRVGSRKLPFELRDLFMLNCPYLNPDDALAAFIPYACVRRMTGTLARVDADSVRFVRHGRLIALAARDVKHLERLEGRSRLRTLAWGAFGAASGLGGSVLVAYAARTDSMTELVPIVAAMTVGGAVIAGYRGGVVWSEWPRAYAGWSPQGR